LPREVLVGRGTSSGPKSSGEERSTDRIEGGREPGGEDAIAQMIIRSPHPARSGYGPTMGMWGGAGDARSLGPSRLRGAEGTSSPSEASAGCTLSLGAYAGEEAAEVCADVPVDRSGVAGGGVHSPPCSAG
jgi:hypothetical protein